MLKRRCSTPLPPRQVMWRTRKNRRCRTTPRNQGFHVSPITFPYNLRKNFFSPLLLLQGTRRAKHHSPGHSCMACSSSCEFWHVYCALRDLGQVASPLCSGFLPLKNGNCKRNPSPPLTQTREYVKWLQEQRVSPSSHQTDHRQVWLLPQQLLLSSLEVILFLCVLYGKVEGNRGLGREVVYPFWNVLFQNKRGGSVVKSTYSMPRTGFCSQHLQRMAGTTRKFSSLRFDSLFDLSGHLETCDSYKFTHIIA